MTYYIKMLGWIGILAGIAYFVVQDLRGDIGAETLNRTRMILFISAGMLASGYVLDLLGRVVGVGKGRCKKCGKRILKTEMFCFDHSVDLVMKSRDRERFGDMSKQHLK